MVKNTPGPEPHRAIYGFSFNLFFTTLFWLYVVWVLPYQALGYTKHFYFVPDTYFAFSCPVFVLCGMVFFLFLYLSVILAQTPDIDSSLTIQDSPTVCKCVEIENSNAADEHLTKTNGISTPTAFVVDIDLSHVSKVLYNRTVE